MVLQNLILNLQKSWITSLISRYFALSLTLSIHSTWAQNTVDNGKKPTPPTSKGKTLSNSKDDLTQDQRLLDDLKKGFFRQNEIFQKIFKDGFLDRMDKVMEDSLSDIQIDFNQINSGFGGYHSEKWLEEKEGKVLVLEGLDLDNGKFDLKLVEDMVTISGVVEKKIGTYGTSSSQFSKSFPVPTDCDGGRMRVEKRDNAVAIVFPWKKGLHKKQKDNRPQNSLPKKTPLLKDKSDLTI